jgi:hypothetical protein
MTSCGAGASWGVFFSAYNRARARYQRRTGSAQLSPAVNLAAAAEAGALVGKKAKTLEVVDCHRHVWKQIVTAPDAADNFQPCSDFGSSARHQMSVVVVNRFSWAGIWQQLEL